MQRELEDGSYTVEVVLSGGSGRASIQSPADLTIENGKMTAEIVWSSPNYDYMEIDGIAYDPVNSEGNSVFSVDVPALDADIPVLAETVAMSEPHMIEYTIRFRSETVRSAENSIRFFWSVPVAAVLSAAVLTVVFAGKRKKKKNEK